jgi:hypothetical protein
MPIKELCRNGGFSDATFYKWRAACGVYPPLWPMSPRSGARMSSLHPVVTAALPRPPTFTPAWLHSLPCTR